MTKITVFWQRLRHTFWVIPAAMIVFMIGLSIAMVNIDQSLPYELQEAMIWLRTISPEGARSILSAVASSLITVAGITFSITMVALSQTSSQYGPRLLTNFMRDRVNQAVLGMFVSIFVYCLLILRTIRSVEEDGFVPQFSVVLALILAVISVGGLVYFFHHIARALQVETIIHNIGRDLKQSMKQLLGQENGDDRLEYQLRDAADLPDRPGEGAAVKTQKSGYIQTIDYEQLEKIATEHDVMLNMTVHAGDFITRDADLVKVMVRVQVAEDLSEAIHNAFVSGYERLHGQDIEFAIDQLVEIAVRALSPGINDPFTAIACIDQLSSALADLAGEAIPGRYQYDEQGKLRVIRKTITFSDLLDAAFHQIRQYGRNSVAVMMRLLEALIVIGGRAHQPEQQEAVERHAEMIKRAYQDENAIPEPNDRHDLENRYQLLMEVLQKSSH